MLKIKMKNNKYGEYVLIDDEDFDLVSQYSWWIGKNGYPTFIPQRADNRGKGLIMHRLIMNPPKDMMVDHINRDKLDNRKSNLRLCYSWQNHANNPIQSNNTSGYKGISWHMARGKWRAYIKKNGKQIFLGYYDDKDKAINARLIAEKEHFGEFSC